MKKHNRVNFAGQGINFLTRQQMEEIHSCTLQLLQETGILVQHKGALEMLEKAGCRVEKKHVYMPPTLVEWAIKAAPSRILLYDRDGNFALDVSGRNT
ncbi:MAG: trimethylamine methyltransferase family protein [Oscillospiraceae bacterium]|nr:trimethylamine methyltransferase family protein [Oscillospiraceae bacterium]